MLLYKFFQKNCFVLSNGPKNGKNIIIVHVNDLHIYLLRPNHIQKKKKKNSKKMFKTVAHVWGKYYFSEKPVLVPTPPRPLCKEGPVG